MIKLIHANYDEDSGISCATIDTDLGKFYGYAFLNKEEDAEIASAYFGCELAEMEANLQYYDYKRFLLAQGLEALYRFRTDLKRNPQYNSESFEVQLLEKRIKQKETQKHLYDVMIKNLKNAIKTRPEQRIKNIEIINQVLEKNKQKKDEE